jgi:hypothetical protein
MKQRRAAGVRGGRAPRPATDADRRRPRDPADACPTLAIRTQAGGRDAHACTLISPPLRRARSAWPYRQSQRRAAGSCRTPIGPQRRASVAVARRLPAPHQHPHRHQHHQ